MSSTSTVPNATLSENSFYVGISLQSILYGVQLGFYYKTIRVLLIRRRAPLKFDVIYAVFSSVNLLLITIRVATEGIYGQKMWLIDRTYPGGPLAYGQTHKSTVYMVLGAAGVVILQQLIDAFMIYRCRIVWDNLRAIVVPSVLWLSNLGLGVLVSWMTVAPWTDFFSSISTKLGLAYTVVSVFLDAMLTYMIWYRLVRYAKTVKYHGEGPVPLHFAIGGLVVESLLPYTLCGIALVVSYGVGSEIWIALSSVYTLMMCISTQMLILRVAEGMAWQKDGKGSDGVISAERGDTSGTEQSDGSGAVALVHLQTLRYK